jgi:hypothetical protein
MVKKVVSEHWQKTFLEAIAKNELIVFSTENSTTKHFSKFIRRNIALLDFRGRKSF